MHTLETLALARKQFHTARFPGNLAIFILATCVSPRYNMYEIPVKYDNFKIRVATMPKTNADEYFLCIG